jgi:hypothetical protein
VTGFAIIGPPLSAWIVLVPRDCCLVHADDEQFGQEPDSRSAMGNRRRSG